MGKSTITGFSVGVIVGLASLINSLLTDPTYSISFATPRETGETVGYFLWIGILGLLMAAVFWAVGKIIRKIRKSSSGMSK